jgi:hypothetical protein
MTTIPDAAPLQSYPFSTSEDLATVFERQLATMPRAQGTAFKVWEFGGIMIRPPGEPRNQLTSIVFPDTGIGILASGDEANLRGHTERSLPQVRLLASVDSDDLLVCFSANRTKEGVVDHVSKVVRANELALAEDVWVYFAATDRERLKSCGFGPGMSHAHWANAIRSCPAATTATHVLRDRMTETRELPVAINQRGVVGAPQSYHNMPGFLLRAVLDNTLWMDDMFMIGSAHLHGSLGKRTGAMAEVVRRVGDQTVQMTVSPADVRAGLISIASHNLILEQHGLRTKDTAESFMSVVGLDAAGRVIGIRHHDYRLIDDLDEMEALNNRIVTELVHGRIDPGLWTAHYQYFSDPSISSDQLGPRIGAHVGGAR